MKASIRKVSILAGSLMIAIIFSGWAKAPQKPSDLGLCPLKQSQAYTQFLNRPICEASKAMFLIDRFKILPHEIIYDGRTYKIKAVSGMVAAFLRFNYKKGQLAKHWVMQYANRGMTQNELILVRLPDGRTLHAGDLLLQELENLEAALSEVRMPETQSRPQPASQINLPEQFNLQVKANSIVPDTLAIAPAAS